MLSDSFMSVSSSYLTESDSQTDVEHIVELHSNKPISK